MKLSLLHAAALLVPSASLLTGCGAGAAATGGQASKPAFEFPSRQELAQLPSKPAPADAFQTSDVVVDAWSFETSPGDSGAAYDDSSPWGNLLRDIVAPNAARVTLSPALRCASAEMARFVLKHDGLPSESLRRFTIARCGGTSTEAVPIVWTVKGKAAEEKLIAELRPKLSDAVTKHVASGNHLVGLATAHEGDRFVAVTTVADDEARLDPGPRSVDAERRITLQGTARGTFIAFNGIINRGEYGYAACETDPRVAPPRFAITCRLDDKDPFAWVEILAQQRGRLLLTTVADLLVHEGDGSAIAYKARPTNAPPTKTAPTAAEFDAALVARLNAVRTKAKLPALTLATKQSAEHARLAGTLIDAEHTHDDKAADRIAIGLLAGWDVDGLIRDGRFFVAQVAPAKDAATWLEYVLERPAGRSTLLDPASRQIAVGPSLPEGVPAVAAAVTTYSLFETRDHSREEQRVLTAIDRARARQGTGAPPLTRITGIPALEAQARLVLDKGRGPMDALQTVLDEASARSGKRVQGYVLETNDLDHFDVPPELLGKGALQLGIAVTHHKAEGAAWGQFVLFLVVIDPEVSVRGASASEI